MSGAKHKTLADIVMLFAIALLIVATLMIQLATWRSADNFNKVQIQKKIDQAHHVYHQYIESRNATLSAASRVLINDFGFRQAVMTADADTLASMLENHGQRIGADLMVIVDLQGEVVASTSIHENAISGGESLRKAYQNPGKEILLPLSGSLYQVVALPVYAPRLVAYSLVGFRVDRTSVLELQRLTGLEISLFADPEVRLTSLSEELPGGLRQFLASSTSPLFFWQRPRFHNSTLDDEAVQIWLSFDLAEIYDEYDNLMWKIIVVTLLILLFSALASKYFARTMTQPLQFLADWASAMSRGQYKLVETEPKFRIHELSSLFSSFRNMAWEISHREEEIRYRAEHDMQTGLLNRLAAFELMDSYADKQSSFALVMISLTNFRDFNDRFGPGFGDDCLKHFSERLTTFCTQTDEFVARYDGIQFIAVLNTSSEDLRSRIDVMHHTLSKPYFVSGLQARFKLSFGCALCPEDGISAEVLLRRATIALENARRHGLPLKFYQQGNDEAYLRRLRLVDELGQVLERGGDQLYLVYQPKMDLVTNKVMAVEALTRWQHPEEGFISPDLFIELAEQSGLINRLTDWVFETVFVQLQTWQQAGIDLEVAVNVAATSFSSPDFSYRLLNQLAASTQSREASQRAPLSLELTERDILSNKEIGLANIDRLRNNGIKVAIDDYGLGESSLSQLKSLPVDELKLDKSFILNLDSSVRDQMIVKSTIQLAHDLNLKVVAEGVENKASLALLRAMGCDSIQGYYLCKPIVADEITRWMEQYAYLDHI